MVCVCFKNIQFRNRHLELSVYCSVTGICLFHKAVFGLSPVFVTVACLRLDTRFVVFDTTENTRSTRTFAYIFAIQTHVAPNKCISASDSEWTLPWRWTVLCFPFVMPLDSTGDTSINMFSTIWHVGQLQTAWQLVVENMAQQCSTPFLFTSNQS